MSSGHTLLTIVIVIALCLLLGPMLIGKLHEAGHIKPPKFGRRKTIRKYPTFPVQGGEEDIELDF